MFRQRWMIRRDMERVLEISGDSFMDAWTEEMFIRHLRESNTIGRVCEHGETIVGYCIYVVWRDHIEVANIAVDYEWRRAGAGRCLIQKVIDSGQYNRQRKRVDVVVQERNLGAQLFFRSLGFRAVEVERGCDAKTAEDAYRMVRRLGDPPPIVGNRIEFYFKGASRP